MQEIIQFTEQFVNGKTLLTKPIVCPLKNPLRQCAYTDQISFCNFKHSNTEFELDMFILSNEYIDTPNSTGNFSEFGKVRSRASLFRLSFAFRKCSGAITGMLRLISASGSEIPAVAVPSVLYDVFFENGTFSFKEDQALYRDQQITQTTYRPIAFSAEHRIFLKSGKLCYHYGGRFFDVDPVVFSRSPSGLIFPPFAATEQSF